jgi:hypothetical protein
MRNGRPAVCELIVDAGRDPVAGRRRQVSRVFRGNLREAKTARAELIVRCHALAATAPARRDQRSSYSLGAFTRCSVSRRLRHRHPGPG